MNQVQPLVTTILGAWMASASITSLAGPLPVGSPPPKVGQWITNFGSYTFPQRGFTAAVDLYSDAAHIASRSPLASTSGALPSTWRAQPGWFAFTESGRPGRALRIWIYDGGNQVHRAELDDHGMSVRGIDPRERGSGIPRRMRERLPASLRERTSR